MKKVIAISVVLMLIAGSVFAVDLGGAVIGTVVPVQGDTGKDPGTGESTKPSVGGGMNRIRLEGAGGDDTFGGWIRLDPASFSVNAPGEWQGGKAGWASLPFDEFADLFQFGSGVEGYAWWQPMEMVKLRIGGFSDGFWGKEGVTGWGFYQTASDTGVVDAGNAWAGDGGRYGHGLVFRNAFYNGFNEVGLSLEINPNDMVAINIGIPYISSPENAEDFYKKVDAQLSVSLDFGNIAVTYQGLPHYYAFTKPWDAKDAGVIYGYFSGAFGDISVDVGVGFQMEGENKVKNPIAFGLGVKYATDTFGVKFRAAGAMAGDDKATRVLADIQPYFVVSDTMTAFVSVGLSMVMPNVGDSVTGWHFNPYLQVGSEWGPKFLAGIQVQNNGKVSGDAVTTWSVPIAIMASF